jgi:hypothetical protein
VYAGISILLLNVDKESKPRSGETMAHEEVGKASTLTKTSLIYNTHCFTTPLSDQYCTGFLYFPSNKAAPISVSDYMVADLP